MRRILAAACVLLAACAPDAVNNRQATGFNGFVNDFFKDSTYAVRAVRGGW